MTSSDTPVYFKRLNQEVIIPEKHSKGAAAYDIHSFEDKVIQPKTIEVIKTGLELTIPKDCKAQLYSRSGLASKFTLFIRGEHISPGCTQELKIVIENKGNLPFEVKKNERIAQLVLLSVYTGELVETENLSQTERGEKGWGSTGVL
ncbi:deoxyuridine 5 -triphosphat [Tubulinosema ratisbonensis]|uniref:Deoxyuridine 5'-triphosphate nucleotidohydrolase n=1 Tax=Tubulinosema ratisbonensis TaxID=291195 RepID=A0A437ALN9_9MICR|nr:deoxyuridine 5 -triphosphat [Tubulinosema ratisbonensis]